MPKYAEYVFTAYGLFAAVIGGYTAWLLWRIRRARRTLETLERAKASRAP